MTKTKEKIRDAEADKFINRLLGDCDYCDLNKSSFVSGFDCRDKMDNEALKIAVEALEYCANNADPTNDMATAQKFLAMRGVCRINLAEIRKLTGEVK